MVEVVEEDGGALSSGEYKDGGHRHQQEQEVLPSGPSAVTQILITAFYCRML